MIMFVVAALTLFCFSGCSGMNSVVGQIVGEKYENADLYIIGNFSYAADEITSVEIFWIGQEVSVLGTDAETLSVSETDNGLKEEQKLRYLKQGGKLTIRYWQSGYKGVLPLNTKKLTVEVPKNVELYVSAVSTDVSVSGISCENCKIGTVSGKVLVNDFSADSLKVDTVSGTVELDFSNADELKIGTTSGDVRLNVETVKTIDVCTTSGKVFVDIRVCDDISAETTSGNVILKLNGQKIKSCRFTTVSGSSNKDDFIDSQDGLTVFVSTTSGSLTIKD